MANFPDKPTRYEVIPFRLVLPGVRLPAREFFTQGSRPNFKRMPVQGFRTGRTSLHGAAQETIRLLRRYRWRVRKDVRVVRELLELNSILIRLPWVAKAAARLGRSKRAHRVPGRPKWRYILDPGVVRGIVWSLQMSGRVKNEHQAVRWLNSHGILSYDRARRLLRKAKKDPRLQPLFFYVRDSAPPPSQQEFAELLENAIEAKPGQTVTFALEDDHARLISVTDTTECR